jgi:hypothetical protein
MQHYQQFKNKDAGRYLIHLGRNIARRLQGQFCTISNIVDERTHTSISHAFDEYVEAMIMPLIIDLISGEGMFKEKITDGEDDE